MQFTFLQGQEPYTKKYERRPDGTTKSTSYPNVFLVTSHEEQVDSLQDLSEALKRHAEEGHCLLTNNLEKTLENESRARHQKKDEPRQWVVLDVDGLNVATVEQFVAQYLPDPFQNVSYVAQYSPSQGIKDGLRCHIYFLLYDAVSPEQVTTWLTWHNVNHDSLSNQVTLSNSNMALSYPLDRVASANGRIVYIAPPECVGFDDPVAKRISLVEKQHDRLSFGFVAPSPAEVRAKTREMVNLLRDARGLPKRTQKEHTIIREDGTEILKDDLIEQGRITSWEEDNDRFMRCNINGGDSFAYYFHRDQENPYLHNFKGEPSVRLQKFDPEFYRKHVVPHFEGLQKSMPRPFVFRDRATDKYFTGVRKDEEIIEQPVIIGAGDKKIGDYFTQHGTSPPAIIETWDRLFDPTSHKQWLEEEQEFNTWRQSEYMENALYATDIPPVCEKILRHVTANDDEAYDHFLNWLAYIVQTRKKTGTAWVLHGVPGTGKGLLFHQIITPLIGIEYCAPKQMKDLTDRFNGWMEQCIVCNIDEANAEDLSYEGRAIVNSLKNWITEPTISIRHMQAAAVLRNSFINFIFTTNDFGVLPIQDGDRRFNVAPRQESPIDISLAEIDAIEDELGSLAAYLMNYEVNAHQVTVPLQNTAKEKLKQAARSSIEEFFHAARVGDLTYFADGTQEDTTEYSSLATFKEAVDRWVEDAKNEQPSLISVPELKAAHIVMCRDKGMKSGAFKSMAAKRNLPCGRPRHGDERIFGWKIDWHLTAEQKREMKMHLKAVPTPAELEEKIKNEIESSSD